MDALIPAAFRILEVMFFVGLVGCFLAILVSWVEIFSDGLSNDESK
jgi:hypothetical protein